MLLDNAADAFLSTGEITIERVTGDRALSIVNPLFREYLPWVAREYERHCGIRLGNLDTVLEHYYDALAAEMPRLLNAPGRLLLARQAGEPVGVVVLKPVDATTGEVKCMYVKPAARGYGIGRMLIERLLGEARAERYHVMRLETAWFMATSHALYRSLGFVDTTPFADSQEGDAGLLPVTRFMALSFYKSQPRLLTP